MKASLYLPVFIVAGFVFITTGILADTWPLRLLYSGLGMATLLAGVIHSSRDSGGRD